MEQVSRQTRRWLDRQIAKQEASANRLAGIKNARRALLDRQTRREKSGFYGRPVADAISPSRSRITTRKVKKGKLLGRIIKTINGDGREYQMHATKGWRSYRLAA